MKHSIRTTALLLTLFLLTQLVGLVVVDNYTDREATAKTGAVTYKDLPYNIERPNVSPQESIWLMLAGVGIGTAILLVLIKFRKVGLWKVWFFLSVAITLSMALASFIPAAAALAASIGLAAWKTFRPNIYVHNITEVFIYGGLAAIFVPMLNILYATILLLAISAYDAIAVWQSRHMVTLAQFQTSTGIFSGLYLPKEAHHARRREKAEFKPGKAAGQPAKPQEKETSAVLGGGDMGFPLIFAGVALKTLPFAQVLIIPAAAGLALLGLMIFGKQNKFYPAMPFITAACLLGYGLSVFLALYA